MFYYFSDIIANTLLLSIFIFVLPVSIVYIFILSLSILY